MMNIQGSAGYIIFIRKKGEGNPEKSFRERKYEMKKGDEGDGWLGGGKVVAQ